MKEVWTTNRECYDNRPLKTEEQKRAISERQLGKKHSEDWKNNISKALLGKPKVLNIEPIFLNIKKNKLK